MNILIKSSLLLISTVLILSNNSWARSIGLNQGNPSTRSTGLTPGVDQQGTIVAPNNQLNKSMIRGKLVIRKCFAYPDFYINGRKHRKKDVVIGAKSGDQYTYVLYIAKQGHYTVEPRMPTGTCGGHWTPRSLSVDITQDKQQILNKNFTFNGQALVKRIPMNQVIPLLQLSLSGTKIHLNNYGPRHGNSWQKDEDSYTEISSGSKIVRKTSTIDEVRSGPYRYYSNDINLNRIVVSKYSDKIKLSFSFESAGTEIKGRCAADKIWKKPLCAVGSDNAAPDVQMNNMKLDVLLKPTVGNGGTFSYITSHVSFDANIQAGGVCRILGDICNLITGYKNIIRRSIKSDMMDTFNDPYFRKDFVAGIENILANQGIEVIQAIRIQGNDLVIWHIKKINNRTMRTF